MPPSTEDDGSEEVNDFLQRIKELGNQRDMEDEERTRKLEEEIIQGRKERQARRAGMFQCLACATAPSTRDGGQELQWLTLHRARSVLITYQRSVE